MADTTSEVQGDEDVDLVDLFLYAPIGLLYEYQEIIPKLVKRGKSQVQVGLLLGKMAAAKGQKEAEKQAGDVLSVFAAVAARGITEIGQVVGLAPPPGNGSHESQPQDGPPETTAQKPPEPEHRAARPLRLPIAGYDDLKARQIIELLDELSPKQRDRIREHEQGNRNRKTVMAKLDVLET